MNQTASYSPEIKALQVRVWGLVYNSPVFSPAEVASTFDSLTTCFDAGRLQRWANNVARTAQQREYATCCPACGGDGGAYRGCPTCGGAGQIPPAWIA